MAIILAMIISLLPNGKTVIQADAGKYLRMKSDKTEESRVTRVALAKAEYADLWEEYTPSPEAETEPEIPSQA